MSSALTDPFSGFKSIESTFHIAPAPDWVLGEEIPWETKPGADDHFIHLLVHTQWAPAKFIRHERNVRTLISREAVQRLSQVELEWDPAIEFLVVHEVAVWRAGVKRSFAERARFMLRQREGELEKHLVHGRMSAILLLDDVRMGDSVEIEFSVISQARLEGEKFDSIFAIERPTITGSWMVTIRLPENAPFDWRSTQKELQMENVIDERTGERVRTVRGRQDKAVEVDPGIPPWIIPQHHFQVTGYQSWQEVAACVNRAWSSVPVDHTVLKTLVAELTNDCNNDEQKAQALIHWVQEQVRYLGMVGGAGGLKPNPPHVALERRYGDCKDKTLLLCSLLRIAGIEAWPFLVSTDRLKGIAQDLPGLGSFNHVITGLRLDGVACYVDGTTAGDGGTPDRRCLPPYGFGLRIQDGVDALETISWHAPEHTAILVTENFHFHLKKPESWVDWRIEATGMDANRLRARLEAVGGEVFNKAEAEDLKQFFRDARHQGPAESQDDLMANRIIIWGRVLFADWGTQAQRGQRQIQYRPRWIYNFFMIPARDEPRTQPFMFPRPSLVRHEIRLHNEQHTFNSDLFLTTNSKWFTCATQLQRPTKTMVLATYSMEWLADVVEPSEIRFFWTKFEEAISNQLGLMLVMGWKGPAKMQLSDAGKVTATLPQAQAVSWPQITLPVSVAARKWLQRDTTTSSGFLHKLKRWILWSPRSRAVAIILILMTASFSFQSWQRNNRSTSPARSPFYTKPTGSQPLPASRYAAFDAAMNEGDFDSAASLLGELHALTTYTEHFAYAQGRYLLALNQIDPAEQCAQDATRMNPASPEAKYLLSRLALRKHADAVKAEILADELTKLQPQSPRSWEASAYAQAAHGRQALAETAARKAVELAPSDFFAHQALYSVLTYQNAPEATLIAVQIASERLPKSAHFPYIASTILQDSDQPELALKAARTAAMRAPRAPRYQANLAHVLASTGAKDEAVRLADKTAAYSPTDAATNRSLGRAYGLAGKPEKALIYLSKVLEREKTADAYNDLGYTYLMLDNHNAAAAELEHAVTLDTEHRRAWQNLVRAYTRAGNTEKATEAQAQVDRLR